MNAYLMIMLSKNKTKNCIKNVKQKINKKLPTILSTSVASFALFMIVMGVI